VLSNLAYECNDTELSSYFIDHEMPTGKNKRILIYKTKAVKSLSKQGYPQPRCHSKARSLNRQLKSVPWENQKWCIADGLALFLSRKYNSSLLKSSKKAT